MSDEHLAGCQHSKGPSDLGVAEHTGSPMPLHFPLYPLRALRPLLWLGGTNICFMVNKHTSGNNHLLFIYEASLSLSCFIWPQVWFLDRNKKSDVNLGSKVTFTTRHLCLLLIITHGLHVQFKVSGISIVISIPFMLVQKPLSLIKIHCLSATYFLHLHLLCHPDFW